MRTDKLLEEFRKIKANSVNQQWKKKNESDRDFVLRKADNQCYYCKLKFPKNQLSFIIKNPEKTRLPKISNGVCACRDCSKKKGSMGDLEFRKNIDQCRQETKKNILENYPEFRKQVFEKYNYTCIYCVYEFGSMPPGKKLTIDHKVPIYKGGTNDIKNLCCACKEHNDDKDHMTAVQYFKEIDKRKNKKKQGMY
jgi:5-methylcytosine-specific restriction endonuclease McrA